MEEINKRIMDSQTITEEQDQLEALESIYREVMEKLIHEVKGIAHTNSEEWKYGLIMKRFEDETENVGGIID